MHIALSIIVAFVVIGVILALLEIRPIKNAVEFVLAALLVLLGGIVVLALASGIGYLLLPLAQAAIHKMQQMGQPSISPSWQALYVVLSFAVAAIVVLVVGSRRSKRKGQ